MNAIQQLILNTFNKRGLLTPDDCSFFMGRFTCSIAADFNSLYNDDYLKVWCDGDDFESTVYMITDKGRGEAV